MLYQTNPARREAVMGLITYPKPQVFMLTRFAHEINMFLKILALGVSRIAVNVSQGLSNLLAGRPCHYVVSFSQWSQLLGRGLEPMGRAR
jgi:hypothetical protein